MTDPNIRLSELFEGFEHTSWRWECQGDYAIDHEALRCWQERLPRDTSGKQRWLDYITAITAAGKTFQRVRMLTEPLTEYLTWMIEFTHENVAAGEDIRWIGQSTARDLGMPIYDFYLFDDRHLAIMRFGADKLLGNLELVDDPSAVDQHRDYRDRVWPKATPHADLVVPERGP